MNVACIMLMGLLAQTPQSPQSPQTPQSPVKAARQTPSFQQRVATFWTDWQRDSKKLHAMVGQEDTIEQLIPDINARVSKLFPAKVAWSFAGADEPDTHQFILASEGDLDQWLLMDYWQKQAPKLAGWQFLGSTPPLSSESFQLGVYGQTFDPDDYTFQLEDDAENGVVHVRIWHKQFAKLEKNARVHVAFLALDHVLGENMVATRVGAIEVDEQAAKKPTCDLHQLAAQFQERMAKLKWDPDARPDQSYSLYQGRPQMPPSFPRQDHAIGTSFHPHLVLDYLKSNGKLDDPLAGTGAHYLWIAIPTQCFDKSKLTDQRGEIEAALAKALSCGRVLGGAYGLQDVCIDLLVFDREQAIQQLRQELKGIERARSATLHFFAKGTLPIVLKQDKAKKP